MGVNIFKSIKLQAKLNLKTTLGNLKTGHVNRMVLKFRFCKEIINKESMKRVFFQLRWLYTENGRKHGFSL